MVSLGVILHKTIMDPGIMGILLHENMDLDIFWYYLGMRTWSLARFDITFYDFVT